MEVGQLAALAWKHARNAAAEELYLQSGHDATRPVAFFGFVNERCNLKCRYCKFWRLERYADEMSIEQWQQALTSVKQFVGGFSISFSGGEPLIKPGFLDLLGWCNRGGIAAGVTTNGATLTSRNVERLVAADPFNVNLSIDAPDAEVHDYLRGCPGLFDGVSRGLTLLLEERDRRGGKFPVSIKPTVNARNFRLLPRLVQWAIDKGASCVNLQPMDRWTDESGELWVTEAELPDLGRVIERLVAMQAEGAPILTPAPVLRAMSDHFRGNKAPPEALPCRVGLRDFFILPDGSIVTCLHYPTLGNIRQAGAREIWCGPRAREIRAQTVECDRLCLASCMSHKTLIDKAKMAVRLLKGQERRAARAEPVGPHAFRKPW